MIKIKSKKKKKHFLEYISHIIFEYYNTCDFLQSDKCKKMESGNK